MAKGKKVENWYPPVYKLQIKFTSPDINPGRKVLKLNSSFRPGGKVAWRSKIHLSSDCNKRLLRSPPLELECMRSNGKKYTLEMESPWTRVTCWPIGTSGSLCVCLRDVDKCISKTHLSSSWHSSIHIHRKVDTPRRESCNWHNVWDEACFHWVTWHFCICPYIHNMYIPTWKCAQNVPKVLHASPL